MSKSVRDHNRHLARACWVVVQEHQERHGRPPTSLYFNKVLSLLHKRLGDQGHDMKLPHCWHRWGDEVVRSWLPTPVQWEHDATTTVGWVGKEPRKPTDRLGKALSETMDEILKESSAQGIEDMVDKVYAYAPFEFQRAYRQIRHINFDAGRSFIDAASVANMTAGLIEHAATCFPYEEFEDASFHARSVFTACKATLEQDPASLETVRESLEQFWTYWCHYLRLHARGHENVPASTLDVWRQELEPQEREFEIVFLAHLRSMIEANPDLRDTEVLRPWIGRLERSDEETSRDIEHWTEVFDGIDRFVQEGKAGYAA